MCNARSVVNKVDHLAVLVDNQSPSIILITESWLQPSIPNSFLKINDRFNIVRTDRIDMPGGGVCAAIKKCLNFCTVEIGSAFLHLEILAFDVYFDFFTVRFILCYRPPYYNLPAKLYLLDLLSCLTKLTQCRWSSIVCGDFNLPGICWNQLTAPNDDVQLPFLDFVINNGFVQFVKQPTRGVNLLDLVMCNDLLLIFDCELDAPLCTTCDHCSVKFRLFTPPTSGGGNEPVDSTALDVQPPLHTYKDFKNANFEAINVFLTSIDWQSALCSGSNVQSMWDLFSMVLSTAIDLYVPCRVKTIRSSTDFKYYPLAIRKLISKKCSAWRKYKHFRTDLLQNRYVQIGNKCQSSIDAFNSNKERELVDGNDVGKFYKYINNKIVTKNGLTTLKNDRGEPVFKDCEKANLLNTFFSSVFTIDNDSTDHLRDSSDSCPKLHDIHFSCDKILKVLTKLKPKMSIGPDGFNSLFLKNIASSIAFPLMLIFNQSFCSGSLPSIWKHAIVTPVFKKGLASDVNNYRPISLTCISCKVMESIIKDKMLDYLMAHNRITKQQHGFLSKHSTCTQLIECVNDWTLALNTKHSVDVVYIDFSKAFDSVVHSKLVSKLKSFGIHGKLLAWIEAYLRNRTQAVKVGNALSGHASVLSGVPQGSVLGPLLFLIFINDIVDVFGDDLQVKLFADDVKIYVFLDNIASQCTLQIGLDKLFSWASLWQLKISIPKCAVLHLGYINPGYTYSLGQFDLPNVKSVKDLGIKIDCDLKFSQHINDIVVRAHQRSALILRCFKTNDPHLLFRAFSTYVRPILEYCAPVWNPCYITYIKKIESVQRRFTRRLFRSDSVTYADRLKFLMAESLELRRLKADLLLMFKITNKLIAIDGESFIFYNQNNTLTRGHSKRLSKPYVRVNCRAHFFACRIINVWNSLPQQLVDSSSVAMFNSSLATIDFKDFLLGN
jgi:hypothetical protein